MFQIPLDMLHDEFEYYEYLDKDEAHNPTYDEPKTIKVVRIDRRRSFMTSSTETKQEVNARIYCYAGNTKPFIKPKEKSKVIIDDTEYVIERVNTLTEPFSREVAAYEIGVL